MKIELCIPLESESSVLSTQCDVFAQIGVAHDRSLYKQSLLLVIIWIMNGCHIANWHYSYWFTHSILCAFYYYFI